MEEGVREGVERYGVAWGDVEGVVEEMEGRYWGEVVRWVEWERGWGGAACEGG
ncbi:hypothetical protein [Spirochaeta thermophila]|uniref:hypothetical protein n=1 Tax=Winmispira thermophila TaxID=154 RepID=UPI0002D8806B|nr:hypothetical protein [Spirochaeta thermophila]